MKGWSTSCVRVGIRERDGWTSLSFPSLTSPDHPSSLTPDPNPPCPTSIHLRRAPHKGQELVVVQAPHAVAPRRLQPVRGLCVVLVGKGERQCMAASGRGAD